MQINNRTIGALQPTYIIAEMSANHNQKLADALALVRAAKDSGADAIKVQTYTADTMTIASSASYFQVAQGTLWEGKNLHALYQEAHLPWDWHQAIQNEAQRLGLDFFSTPFDESAVDFLEQLQVPVYKIASFELVDIPLIEKVAQTQKPMIVSTGMATLTEIQEAVQAIEAIQNHKNYTLLKCTSAYPAPYNEMNLRTIGDLQQKFGCPVGLSDHSLGIEVPLLAVALGAVVIEKHFTLDRKIASPDSAFSLEPAEFKQMVQAVRVAEQALGRVSYSLGQQESKSKMFRRSLFIVKDMQAGEVFSPQNLRCIRPANGLAPKYLKEVLGKRLTKAVKMGTPLDWDLVSKE